MRLIDLTLFDRVASIAIAADHVVSILGEAAGAKIELSTGQVVHVRENYVEVFRLLTGESIHS